MPYSERIKNFERIRDYMRQFYVYGFKSREEYNAKSARSYDNERRRIESWLGDAMRFRQSASGKAAYISIDSRSIARNPLYNAFKAKSFTNGDITFHFYVLDLLADGSARSVRQIADAIAERYLAHFERAEPLDESSIRKKLKEYEELGILESQMQGRERMYRRAADRVPLGAWADAVAFFAEENPLGVIGSFLLDKLPAAPNHFCFKHHYILNALDSQVLCDILLAMQERRCVEIKAKGVRSSCDAQCHAVFPWKIYISTQSGRQYLLCYHYRFRRPMFFRLDGIRAAQPGPVEREWEKYAKWCRNFGQNLWGVSADAEPSMEHLEMTLRVDEGEAYIIDRLEREKRCGSVERIDGQTLIFRADVYDAAEMLPWIRTFIGRIEALECSNAYVTDTFRADLDAMRALYAQEDDHAVQ